MYFTVAIWMIGFQHVCFGISITFDPTKPAFGDSVTIVCKRTSSSTTAITWDLDSSVLTTCDGTTENACIPSPTGHTYRTDVSANVFNLTLASVSLADCKTYTCTDAVDTGSSDLYIAKYTASDTVLTNPGAYRSGTISVKTGCVFPTSDVTVTWKIVKVNGNVEEIDGTDTTDTTGCSYTCHSQTSGKAISSITHTECSTPTCEEVTYRAIISHSSYSSVTTLDSATFRIPGHSTTSVATTTVISDASVPDVAFMYVESCYSIGDSLTMTAVYSGTGTVTAVQWYYSASTETNVVVAASTCTVFGSVPAGFPDSSRMSYECPSTHSLPFNIFKLTLTGLQADEIDNSWGATFVISGASSADIVKSRIPLCSSTSTRSNRYVTTTSSITSDATGTSSSAASSHLSITTSPYRGYPTEGGNRNFDMYVIIGICVGSALLIL